MDGIQKTALFLSGLEWKTVDLLLGRLDPESAKAVRRAMMSLGMVSPQDSSRLAGEFLNAAGRTNAPELTSTPGTYSPYRTGNAARAYGETVQIVPENDVATKNVRPFGFLASLDAELVAGEIAGEHTQTIAVVLAHLPASRAGEVLGLLPEAVQVDVARRLAEFDPVSDTEFLPEIEAVLKERFERHLSRRQRRRQGAAVMQHILKATDPQTQARILSTLRREGKGQGDAAMVSEDRAFAELAHWEDRDLAELFRSVDLRVTMLALVGADPLLIERVTGRLTPTDKQRMRQELKRLGPIDETDVRRARRHILERRNNGE